jgi:hypothetical protein
MEGHFSTGQNPQRTVAHMEEEEEEYSVINCRIFSVISSGCKKNAEFDIQ